MGVLQAAVFRAQSPVCTYCVCLKYLCVVMAGDDIGLICELRNPETVNDVGRLEGDVYDRVIGDGHFIVGDKAFALIVALPLPLLSNDLQSNMPSRSCHSSK